jgi:hypothetical protein
MGGLQLPTAALMLNKDERACRICLEEDDES